MITVEELAEIKARAERAAAWCCPPEDGCSDTARDYRTDVPRLVAEVERLRRVLEWYATGNGAVPNGHCGDYGEKAREALK